VPVSESEDVPITSPIVLVPKRTKPKEKPSEITKDYSLSSYWFCCDFRYLNSQTQCFRYKIKTPRYITSIDLASGFFQMAISPESTK